MSFKKITYNPKSRNDISNPYNKLSHDDLLRLGKVTLFNGNFIIQKLKNGRIKVLKGKDNNKKQ